MSYTTPVTDRTAADVAAKNTKAYFNVADWTRIYDNTFFINAMLEDVEHSADFTTISTPTITTIPSVTNFNTLIQNIKNVQIVVESFLNSPTGLAVLKTDWAAGAEEQTFNYLHVNSWEQNISILYTFLNNLTMPRKNRSGITTSGSSLTRNNRFRG